MKSLQAFVADKRARGPVYPPKGEVFNALAHTPFEKVRVVILGQDPYHGPGQAHGLCFSVKHGVVPPPSLKNIFKELAGDAQLAPAFAEPHHGELTAWADQGVLLLNNVLTVDAGNAHSHAGQGWELFTDRVVKELNERREGLVFLLWGSPAQKKAAMVDRRRHWVLEAPHPSPLSAYRGFFGCGHFSKVNAYLEKRGEKAIDWNLR
jgi:uracil-DNA glycosylase